MHKTFLICIEKQVSKDVSMNILIVQKFIGKISLDNMN